MIARSRRLLPFVAAGLLLASCGGDGAPARTDAGDVLAKLRSIPSIVSVTEGAVRAEYAGPGRRFFVLELEQPVDHANPSAGTFRQAATLFYVGDDAPMVLATSGYDAPRTNVRTELAALLEANQLYVEHRFFGASTPAPVRWDALTIAQSAEDFHAIVAALRPLFPGGWVSTGASKGGMTAVYHRAAYPDDVDATVAYVAPNSLDPTDDRYVAFVNDVFGRNGEAACLDQVRALQRAILAHRADVEPVMREDAASRQDTLTLLGATPAEASARALEFALVEAPFALWQYSPDPTGDCEALLALSTDPAAFPDAQAFARNLYAFLELTLGGVPSWLGDAALRHYEAYYFQSATELGGPDYPGTAPGELLVDGIPDDPRRYPPFGPEKAWHASAMPGVQAWVTERGERLMFVYGENDPWTAGAFVENPARDQVRYTVVGSAGNHGARLTRLTAAEQAEALARLRAWLGVAATGAAPTALEARATPAFDDDALLRGPGSSARR